MKLMPPYCFRYPCGMNGLANSEGITNGRIYYNVSNSCAQFNYSLRKRLAKVFLNLANLGATTIAQ